MVPVKTIYQAYLVKISGRVTGVGFRYSARDFIKQFSEARGYVKNIAADEVEVLVQAKKDHMDVILAWLSHGPSHARVDDIKINPVPLSEELGYFSIR